MPCKSRESVCYVLIGSLIAAGFFILILNFALEYDLNDKFSHFKSSNMTALRILCYGDSLTAGYFNGGRKYWPYSKSLQDMLEKNGNQIVPGCTPLGTASLALPFMLCPVLRVRGGM